LEEAEILISRNLNRDYTEHTFFHELMHALLEAGGSKKTEDEYFVDSTAGLLHQFMKTKSGTLE
jgi:Zn-dependent peptidase ImmA (M78 family)